MSIDEDEILLKFIDGQYRSSSNSHDRLLLQLVSQI